MKEKIKDRYNILGVLFLVLGAVIVLQLANLQVIQGQKYDDESQNRLLNEREIVAPRGNIMDRNGVPIAVNRRGFIVQMVDADLNTGDLNDMLYRLIEVFEKNHDSYNDTLNKFITYNPIGFGNSVKRLKDPISSIKLNLGLNPKKDVVLKTPQDVFKYLRKEKYKISDKYNDEQAYKIMTLRFEIRHLSSLNPTTLAENVSNATVAQVEERHRELPGVTTDIEPIRKYVDAQSVAHVVGYTGVLNDSELEQYKKDGYDMSDYIGKSGIERAAEEYLRGTNGQRRVEVDTEGRLTEELGSKPATPGDNVVLTVDMKLQRIAMESLKENIDKIKNKEGETNISNNLNKGDASAGAVVAMDVNTGEILAMASYPSYDPSVFLEGADNKQAQKTITQLFTDTTTPLLNRAIQGIYAPGSTFKPMVGVAGLQEGIITADSLIDDTGVITVDGQKFYSMEYKHGMAAMGPIDLSRALAASNNIFFYKLGMMLRIDKLDKWAEAFGLGKKTGIDIGGESSGRRSNPEIKKKYDNNDLWGAADTAQTSIGQLYNAYTPLQLVDYISAVGNGGKLYKPFLMKRVVAYDGKIVKETKPSFQNTNVRKETIDAVKQGMIAVTNAEDGTAAHIFDGFPFKVAAKTGTAETGYESKSNNGVFVCYAPADKPQIAIVIVIEHGVYGKFGAPIARDIMAEYFHLNNKDGVDDSIKSDEVTFTR